MIFSINKTNRNIAISIMQEAMGSNPNLSWMTGGNSNRLINFYKFCLRLAMLYKGAYLNSDKKGIVLFYKRGASSSFFRQIKGLQIYTPFIFNAIKISKLFLICKLQNKIQKFTPKTPHLYCLIIAVKPNQKSTQTIIQLRDFLFQQSQKKKLPIYVQTSLMRNKILFEHYGFECYKEIPNGNYKLWLLKRDYEK